MSQPEIMTAQEVADLLRVSERTVYDWATNGQIPCGKLGTAWRFKRSEVERWIDQNLAPKMKSSTSIISLGDILSAENVIKFDTSSKREALQHMIDVVSKSEMVENKEQVEAGIFHREELMSTGIGLGVAVPHVRLKSIKKPVMAVGICGTDIVDYETLDKTPIRILFMILAGINQHSEHIKILSKISGFIKDGQLRESLLNAEDEQSTFNLLVKKAN